jgi:uncharacterized paraquat-inducible protein A
MSRPQKDKPDLLASIATDWHAVGQELEAALRPLALANLQEAVAYEEVSAEDVEQFVHRLSWLTIDCDNMGREWMNCPRCGDRMRVSKPDVVDKLINHNQVTLCKSCSPGWPLPRGTGLTPRQQLGRQRTDS